MGSGSSEKPIEFLDWLIAKYGEAEGRRRFVGWQNTRE